jgi:hypothetical protein
VTMTCDIQPLTLNDLPELSRFLTVGFQAPPAADFAAPEVLRWKYLEPPRAATGEDDSDAASNQVDFGVNTEIGMDSALSYVARDDAGRIVGHVGLCRTAMEGQGITTSGARTATVHIIDWLGSRNHHSVGISLMRRAHHGVATQFGLGVSQAALAVGERAGYELRSLVPVYSRVLRTGYWFRTGNLGLAERGLRLAWHAMSQPVRRPAACWATIMPKRVSAFGPEIASIVEKAKSHVILTQRDATRLNTFLRFPRQAMSGWHLLDETGRLRGFAVLNLVPQDQGQTQTGKVVDCLLDDIDTEHWQAAILALTQELKRQGADIAQAHASTPWTAEALHQCGYVSRFAVKFHIRDRLGLIPHGTTFHLTPLEGDYAYT